MSRFATSTSFLTRSRQIGLSLVELMVAMALSLVLLGGVLAIFASSRTTYETTDRLSRIQESGRFALDTLTRDIRTAGYIGCSQRAPFTTTLANSNSVLWNYETSVEGFDSEVGASGWAPAIDGDIITEAVPENDILVVRIPRPDSQSVRVTADMETPTDAITIDPDLADSIVVNDIVMISDCNARAIFEVTAKTGDVLSHDESAAAPAEGEEAEAGEEEEDPAATPGNSSGDLGYAFTTAAEVVPMQTVIYYLRAGSTPDAGPSLWRRVSGGNAPQELVEGIENMQLAYGERDGANIVYRRADEVDDWNNVVSVNIALLVRSLSEYGAERDTTEYELLGDLGTTVSAPDDRHMRQVFTTTVTLRNATL